jgi:hypothetical protein
MDWNRVHVKRKDVRGRKVEHVKQLKVIGVKANAVSVQCEP